MKLIFIIISTICMQIVNSKTYMIINKFEINDNEIIERDDPPPDHKQYAKMARWLVHNNDWTAMGTISTSEKILGFPMVNVIAIADSARLQQSTGNIYFYLTMLDFTAQDLSKNNKLTALFSMDQSLTCSKQNIDPMEPTCGRAMISGEALRVDKNSDEFNFATNAMLSRHPSSANWLNTHDFFLCKLNISSICILDWYGGPHYVTIEDYFKANLEDDEFLNLKKF